MLPAIAYPGDKRKKPASGETCSDTTTSPDAADEVTIPVLKAANVPTCSSAIAPSQARSLVQRFHHVYYHHLLEILPACCKSSMLSPLRIPSRAAEIGKCWWIRAGEYVALSGDAMASTHTNSLSKHEAYCADLLLSRRRCPQEMCPALSPRPSTSAANHGR